MVDVDKGVAELLAARLPVAVALAERDEMGVPDAVVLSLPFDVFVELLVLVPEPVPVPVTVTDAAAVPLAEAVLVTLGVDVAEGVIEAVPAALPVRVFVPVAAPLAERDELGVPDAVAALVTLVADVAEGAVEVRLEASTERTLVTAALDEPVPVQLEAVALGVALPVPLPVAVALPEPLRRLATMRPRYVSRATTASGDSLPAPTAPAAAGHSSTDSRSPPV